jgi:hypothetical protein
MCKTFNKYKLCSSLWCLLGMGMWYNCSVLLGKGRGIWKFFTQGSNYTTILLFFFFFVVWGWNCNLIFSYQLGQKFFEAD